MPTTVTSSAGTVYHLFQGANSVKTASMGIGFTELRNDLGNGYRAQRLYGSNTGLRKWKLTLPTLADTTVLANTLTSVNGETVSREMYLWDLYCESRVTGQPFVYTCPRNGQYYLVDFKDDFLDYGQDNMNVKLYSTGVEIEQVREDGETVFDVSKMSTAGFGYDWFDQSSHGAGVWTNKVSGGLVLTATGDVVFSANPQNGLNTVRLSGSASTGVLNSVSFNAPIFELFIVMKMREATFSNAAGIFTGSSGTPVLVGTSAGTKFQNLLGGSNEYYLNGVEYAQANMQAPMNEFGIVRIKTSSVDSGWDPGLTVQFGKDQATAGTFAKVDIAEIISFAQRVPTSDVRELLQHLTVKWGIV